MARYVSYQYRGLKKQIPFSYAKFSDLFDAVAAAEGVDLTSFRAMEKQIASLSKPQQALKDFHKNEMKRLGFSDIKLLKDIDESNT